MLNELKTQIKVIDRKVDAIHRKMRRLETIDLYSAASWQAAWDKHPDLHSQEAELYRQRGNLQAQIAQAEYEATRKQKRTRKPLKLYPASINGKHFMVTIPED
jgi:hypothetical protein